MMMTRIAALLFLLPTCAGLWAQTLPGWMLPLREAVYEQELSAEQIRPLYLEAKSQAQARLSGAALDLALSRCEYFMGRAYQYYKQNNAAFARYTEGMRLAERALAAAPSSEGWVMRAENLSQACAVGSMAFTMANGLDVERFAKNALAINSRNAAAQIIVAARWVYAPAPLHNHKRGIEMMMAIPNNSDMERDDRFNVYIAIGYAYIQQRKFDEARPWILRALEVYPTNKIAAELLNQR